MQVDRLQTQLCHSWLHCVVAAQPNATLREPAAERFVSMRAFAARPRKLPAKIGDALTPQQYAEAKELGILVDKDDQVRTPCLLAFHVLPLLLLRVGAHPLPTASKKMWIYACMPSCGVASRHRDER